MIVISFLFLFKKNYLFSGLFAFFAAIFREMLIFALLIFSLISFLLYLKNRKKKQTLVIFSLFLLLFLLIYPLHYIKASQYIAKNNLNQILFSIISNWNIEKLIKGFLAPTCYMMFPYGFFKFPPFLFMLFAMLGFYSLLKNDLLIGAASFFYILFWTIFFLTVGASSSYWGQYVMPLAILGTALLLGSLDNYCRRKL